MPAARWPRLLGTLFRPPRQLGSSDQRRICPTPLWLECYVLELPFDTGLPDNYVLHVKDDASGPVESGWAGFSLGDLLGIDPEPPTAQMRSTTLAFRRAEVSTWWPLAALEKAFPAILLESQLGFPWWKRRWLRSRPHRWVELLRPPPPQARSVVAATRVATPPADGELESHWRGDQMTACLGVLNDYLEALSGVRTNLAVGPVAAPDLPPLLLGYRRRLPDALGRAGTPAEHFVLVLHEFLPWATAPLTWQQAEQAMHASLARDQPFMQAMAWLRAAERALSAERPRHAVIDACTAIELAVSDVIRTCAPRAGYRQTKVDNILEGAFASKVKDHVAPILGLAPDVTAAADQLGAWWRDGYAPRNAVVHRAYRPSLAEATRAVLVANELLDTFLDRVRADARFGSVLPSQPDTVD